MVWLETKICKQDDDDDADDDGDDDDTSNFPRELI